jgi:hypothetical protein
MSKSGSERRAHRRVAARFALSGTPDAGHVARMVASNLSMAGLQCTSSADFPELTRLAVRLELPVDGQDSSTAAVDIEAVVVRREETESSSSSEGRFRLALFFTKVDDTAKRRLASYLEARGAAHASSMS